MPDTSTPFVPVYMGLPYVPRPESGRCWVCNRPDSVPAEHRDKLPALCGEDCRLGWVGIYGLDSPATHVATADGWAPLTAAPGVDGIVVEIHAPVTEDQRDEPERVAKDEMGGAARVVASVPPLHREPVAGTWWARVRARWVQ